jgi:DNA-binding NtrC family response regulator
MSGVGRIDERMATDPQGPKTILLVEADVIVRFAVADHLRACAIVIEAASAQDARQVLVAGPPIDIVMSDAQLAGDENGFALAQWVRRHRPDTEVILTSSIINKAQAASEFCARHPDQAVPADANGLATRIHAMMAERKRRLRPPSTTAAAPRRRKRQ